MIIGSWGLVLFTRIGLLISRAALIGPTNRIRQNVPPQSQVPAENLDTIAQSNSFVEELFNHLPLSGLIAERILCMHGGLSPELKSLNDLRNIARPNNGKSGLEVDLLWADPIIGLTGFMVN